jgi:hypothetical protein
MDRAAVMVKMRGLVELGEETTSPVQLRKSNRDPAPLARFWAAVKVTEAPSSIQSPLEAPVMAVAAPMEAGEVARVSSHCSL